MSMAGLMLSCYVWGEPSNCFFNIEIKDEVYVADLRETIRKKRGFPGNRNLSLFKVSIPKIDIQPGFRVRGTPNDIKGSVMLHSQRKLEDIFNCKSGGYLNPNGIHIIVMERFMGMVPLSFTKYYPRAELVEALYNKLNKERFVQVRGPPASGKSALSELLASYIEKAEPGVAISYISNWHQNRVESYGGCWTWLYIRKTCMSLTSFDF